MLSTIEVFEKIKITASTKEKIQILKDNNSEELREILIATYNPDTIYGITSKMNISIAPGGNDTYPIALYGIIKQADGRNEKIKLLIEWLSGKTKEIINYFLRSVDKDLGIGISVKNINKAIPGLIKEFKLMLAKKRDKEEFESKFSDTQYGFVNIKIDGIRAICCINGKEDIKFYSRDGKLLSDFLVENIRNDLKKQFNDDMIGKQIDGEIYTNDFQNLMSVVMRKEFTATSIATRNSCKYAVFDIILQNIKLEERVKILNNLIQKSHFIRPIPYFKIATDFGLICKLADKVISEGKEGLIIKHPSSFYEFKRSSYWMKFKDSNDIDLQIIGTEMGERGTKYENKLGAVVLKLNNGNEVRCGTGFSDKERLELWNKRDELIGTYAEIKYMENTNDGNLRHPVFVRLRPDKTS